MKKRVKSLERATAKEAYSFACPECGEVFVGRGDVALDLVVREWLAGMGQEPKPDRALERIVAHEHDALREVVLRDIPALSPGFNAQGAS